jgi:hypothetical protein
VTYIVPDSHTILASFGTAIAVVGLITAAIGAGKKLAVELGFFKKAADIFPSI